MCDQASDAAGSKVCCSGAELANTLVIQRIYVCIWNKKCFKSIQLFFCIKWYRLILNLRYLRRYQKWKKWIDASLTNMDVFIYILFDKPTKSQAQIREEKDV